MARYALLIDYDYCTGCHSCEVACQQEHDYPVGTNGVVVTNLPGSLLGSIGYLQLQTMGNQGTNTTTNHSVLIWRKPKRNG